jgi:uncharacterized membrane protein
VQQSRPGYDRDENIQLASAAARPHLVCTNFPETIMRMPLSLSLAKTATFAVVHFSVAFGIAYLLTGSAAIAGAIALIEPLANTVAYFLHERAWSRFGRAVPLPTTAASRSK